MSEAEGDSRRMRSGPAWLVMLGAVAVVLAGAVAVTGAWWDVDDGEDASTVAAGASSEDEHGSADGAAGEAAPLASEEVAVAPPISAHPHLVWLNDIAFTAMPDGRAILIDADAGTMLGMISGGYGHNSLLFSPDGRRIYNPETYYARGTRGARTDVLTVYDAGRLTVEGEIVLPAKRFLSMPLFGNARLMDGGRFALIYNFTPSQSVSVADVVAGRFVTEFDTAGCSLIFPVAPREFFMLCADGGLLEVALDADGRPVRQVARERFFDADRDPLFEKPVRVDGRWLFVSFHNAVYEVAKTDGGVVGRAAGWRLADPAEGWRLGGIQPLAVHAASGRLFALMHEGGEGSHKDPGTEVRVYDLKTRAELARWRLRRPATSIAVSGDADDPLLYAVMIGDPTLEIYSAKDGSLRRRVGEIGITVTLIQPVPAAHGEGDGR